MADLVVLSSVLRDAVDDVERAVRALNIDARYDGANVSDECVLRDMRVEYVRYRCDSNASAARLAQWLRLMVHQSCIVDVDCSSLVMIHAYRV